MDLIYQNPFRVLGIPITATDREIAKQISDLTIYAEMGKHLHFDSDDFFPIIPIRTIESILEAKQKIDQPSNKLFHSLFWFWENSKNTIDKMAFEELKNGNNDRAIDFWEKETVKGITSKNKSNHKNLAVLQLALTVQNDKLVKNHFLSSLSLSGEFFANGHFEEFANQVLGKKHTVNLLEASNHYIDENVSTIKNFISKRKVNSKVTYKEIFQNMKSFPVQVQNYLQEKAIGPATHNIEQQIEKSVQKRNKDVSVSNKTGIQLYKNTVEDLEQLQLVLIISDLKYQLIADKLANELISCSIDYFNKYRDTDIDPGEEALELTNYARKIAVSKKVKDRINEGLPILEEYIKEQPSRIKLKPVQADINFIYDKVRDLNANPNMKEIQDITLSFVESCQPKLDSIKSILGKTDENYLELSDIVAGNALGLCFELMTNAADFEFDSDYDKRSTIQWVRGQVESVFTMVGHLDMSYAKRKEYTDFCKQVGFQTSGGNAGGEGCYIATMVYGSYAAQEVMILKKFRDEILLKSKFGQLFVKIYYQISPTIVKKTKNIKFFHSLFRGILRPVVNILNGSE